MDKTNNATHGHRSYVNEVLLEQHKRCNLSARHKLQEAYAHAYTAHAFCVCYICPKNQQTA